MIRYHISTESEVPPTNNSDLEKIKALINTCSPGWLANAEEAAENCIRAAEFQKSEKAHWRLIKSVYKKIQHKKCGFCERSLSGASLEYDLDHFRPKGSVSAWPPDS